MNTKQSVKRQITIPLSNKDFAWIHMTEGDMKRVAREYISHKKKVFGDIKKIKKEKRTYLNTLYALERCDDKFESFFSKMALLSEVSTNKKIRDTAHAVATDVSQKVVDVVYDKDLYRAMKEYYEGNYLQEKKNLRAEDILLLEDTMRDFRRMGFDLSEKKQNELKKLLKQATDLSTKFRQYITEYQDYILCTEEELAGLSQRFISSLPRHTDGRYIVTLAYPHIGPFLGEAKNRAKRKELAEKNLKKGGAKNLKIIHDLVVIRHKIASILSYNHHADFVTERRMAKNATTVDEFQDKLLKRLAPYKEKDMKDLRAHAKTLGITELEHYDLGYVGTELKKKLYDLDPETVRTYFPLNHVRDVMFTMFSNLFSLSIKKRNVSLWHKDVETFEIHDKKGKNSPSNSLLGYFSMDLFPREGKFSHAGMFDVVVPYEKEYKSEEYVAPYSVMVCNFPAPHKKTPSLLSIGEVETLFHEFGHLLHMTITRARIQSQAGANVAWDFVETPSQIMENWVWNKMVLTKLSHHYMKGKRMPPTMIERIIQGKKFQNGLFYTRQLLQGKMDMDLHTGRVKDGRKAWIAMNKLHFNITLPEKETLFPAGFGHLVGYDAGYYSYLWALVYACDAYKQFELKGNKNVMTNTTVGLRWRKEVLEKGGSVDEMALITNFLGRKPNDKAFLEEVVG
jgi:thimet oligopeptidase